MRSDGTRTSGTPPQDKAPQGTPSQDAPTQGTPMPPDTPTGSPSPAGPPPGPPTGLPPGPPTSAVFTDSVTLKPVEPEHFDLAFTATTQPCPWPKAYGGDLVGQAAAAAMRSVTDGKAMHSMHSYFLRPADIAAQVRYEVEILRDGRGYSTRQVRAYQQGKPIYVCLANFAAGEPGRTFDAGFAGTRYAGFDQGIHDAHADRGVHTDQGIHDAHSDRGVHADQGIHDTHADQGIHDTHAGQGIHDAHSDRGVHADQDIHTLPDPESLPSSAAYLAGRVGGTMTEASRAYWSGGRGFDMRHVPGPVYLTVEGGATPHQAVWIRPFDALRPVEGLTDGQRDAAALAYVCDYTILEPVLRVLGLPWAMPGLVTASLDHAMWFHRSPAGRLDDWVLYAQEAVAADTGRGLATGRFLGRDGRHLATVAQEGMIRVR